jgi:predicted small metal-binding protein
MSKKESKANGGGNFPLLELTFPLIVSYFVWHKITLKTVKGANMKALRCSDAGFDCEGKVSGASEQEILSQAAEHARAEHNIEVTPEMAEQLKALIRDEE